MLPGGICQASARGSPTCRHSPCMLAHATVHHNHHRTAVLSTRYSCCARLYNGQACRAPLHTGLQVCLASGGYHADECFSLFRFSKITKLLHWWIRATLISPARHSPSGRQRMVVRHIKCGVRPRYTLPRDPLSPSFCSPHPITLPHRPLHVLLSYLTVTTTSDLVSKVALRRFDVLSSEASR